MTTSMNESMHIDCATCPARGRHCSECMVAALVWPSIPVGYAADEHAATTSGTVPLDAAERRAVEAFVAAGLIDRHAAEALRAHRDVLVRREAG